MLLSSKFEIWYYFLFFEPLVNYQKESPKVATFFIAPGAKYQNV